MAVVGAGNMGRHHARNYDDFAQADLRAIVDTDLRRAEALALRHACRAFSSVEELLAEEPGVKAVSVVTPTRTHVDVTAALLSAGKHVLVEKPIAASPAEADRMIALAQEHDVVLAVGHVERFNPAVRELKRCIERGDMGEIVSVFARRVGVMPPQVKDANVILDLAIHDIDVFRYLLGADRPTEVFCNAGRVNGGDLFDFADVFLRFDRVACLLQVNWVTPVKIRELAVTGTRGYAEVEYVRQELRYHSAQLVRPVESYSEVTAYSEQAPQVLAHEHVEPLARELGEFLRAVEGRPAEIVTGEEGKRSMEIALELVERAELVESG
ncbi:MAG: Gfo/Idh/MocA family oxidoreductase [Actinomycetota bacterium]|nr:Gfo/Idh/MocA family oxidoreductase [Actinomycetota bacterium]